MMFLEITLEVYFKVEKLVEQLVKWQCLILEQESRLNIKRTPRTTDATR
jgi:hypothetical protein